MIPAPRIRTRSVTPVPRVRVRNEPGIIPTRQWRAPHSMPEDADRGSICRLGEIDKLRKPADWLGWPNGSLYLGAGGVVHKGRHIPTPSGKFHVIRWNPFLHCYSYVKLAKDHTEAIASL